MKTNIKNKGFIVQGVIGVITLALIIGGVYYVKTKRNDANMVPPIEHIGDDMSEWKTYIESDSGFEFKYPSDSIIKKMDQNGITNITVEDRKERENVTKPEYVIIAPELFQITVHPENTANDQYNFVLNSENVVPGSINDVSIDGIGAKILKTKWKDTLENVILIKKNLKLYTLYYLEDDSRLENEGNNAISKAILSTFKFTN